MANKTGELVLTDRGYTNLELLKKAKTRCKHCHASYEKNEVLWYDEGDCDITAVLVCKEWSNEKIGSLVQRRIK